MLDDLQFDKQSHIPLHQQLYKTIKEAILSGKLMSGEKLPTEEAYHAAFGLSRPVIRQAYKQLMNEHLIDRQKGKGSFVKHKAFNYELLASIMPLNEKIRRSGFEPSIIELDRQLIFCQEPFNKNPGHDLNKYLRIKRLYKGDDQILFYMETYRPLALFPELEHISVQNTSITQYIKDTYGYSIDYARRTITAVVLSDEMCRHFKLPTGSPAFQLDTTSFTNDGLIIEYSIAYIQGQNVSVSFDFLGT